MKNCPIPDADDDDRQSFEELFGEKSHGIIKITSDPVTEEDRAQRRTPALHIEIRSRPKWH